MTDKLFNFDFKGNLTPYDIIETDLDKFKTFFVDSLLDIPHRTKLFDNYFRYMSELNELINVPYFQWLNGSFATNEPFPGDIDVVSFIDYKEVERYENELQSFMKEAATGKYNTDAYIVKVYPANHQKNFLTKSDMLKWQDDFGHKKIGRINKFKSRKRLKKGFLKIEIK